MNYLFTMWDGGGSVPPELALVRRLIARGHAVTVLAGPTLRAEIEATGATFRAWQRVPHRRSATDTDPFADHDLTGPGQLVARLLERLFAGPAADYAAEVGAALDARPADVLVSSFVLLGALAGAEARGVPSVALMPQVYALPAPGMPPFGTGWAPAHGRIGRLRDGIVNGMGSRLWARGTPVLNSARAGLGLAPLAHILDQVDAAERVLVLTSQAFDFPAGLPANVRYVGPQLDDPGWAEQAPCEVPAGDEPLVLVGLSSTFMDQGDLLRRIVAALATLPVRALVTTGPEVDPTDVVGTERIRVVRSAPHSAVLPHATAVVTHGGHGTVVKALAAGVPQLVIPLGRDQPDNAARVVAAGAGLRLPTKAGPTAIARAVRRLLDEPALRDRAVALGAVLRADATSGAAIDELEAVAATSPTSS